PRPQPALPPPPPSPPPRSSPRPCPLSPPDPACRPSSSAAITSAPAGRPTTTRAIRLGLRRDLPQPRLVGHCHSPPLHGRCCLGACTALAMEPRQISISTGQRATAYQLLNSAA